MRRWFGLVLAGIAFLSAWIAVRQLPSVIALDFSRLLPFSVSAASESGSSLLLFVVPGALVLIWALFRWLQSESAARLTRALYPRSVPDEALSAKSIERFQSTYEELANFVSALMLAFHFMLLGLALEAGTGLLRASLIAVGALLMFSGNLMPRLRPNPVMGVRTPGTLRDPKLWAQTNRVFGALFVLAGLATIAAAIVALRFALTVAVVGLFSACAFTALYVAFRGSGGKRTGVVLALSLQFAIASAARAQLVNVPADPPANVQEEALSFTSAGITLAGTLTTPAARPGRIPFAVIIAGSGPTDRNGNGPLARTNLYAQMAWQLAQKGIGSFRYDKRGIGPEARKIDHSKLVIDDFVADVLAAVTLVRAQPKVGRVLLIGHSEGAQLALQAVNRGARIDALVLLSGAGRTLPEVLHDQFALQLDSAGVAKVDAAFRQFLNGEDPEDVPAAARVVFVPLYRTYLKSMAAYEPVEEIRRAQVPILIAHAEMDLQIRRNDAQRLLDANPRATFLLLPKANHVMKRTESMDPEQQKPLYSDPTLPIVNELVPGIVKWFRGL